MKMIEIVSKINVENKKLLALIYTPGVAKSSTAIHQDYDKVFDLTNRSNSVAVLSFDYFESLKRSVYLKETYSVDAYPLEINFKELSDSFEERKKEIDFLIENIMPNFIGVDTVLLGESYNGGGAYDAAFDIPKRSKGCLLSSDMKFEDMEPVELRRLLGGVIETKIVEIQGMFDNKMKPIAIVSDGSAVLGLGNIGAEAGLPVMEGKAVLFKDLGEVNAMPLCLKTQVPSEIERIVYLLSNSFSGINLEDISAPRCFEIEENLIKTLDIPVFHDDQHGTAIVVLAGLLNALKVAKKELDKVKIVFSGAGAAGQAIAKLLIKMREYLNPEKKGGDGILMFDKSGAIYRGRKENDSSLGMMAEITNFKDFKGSLCDGIKGADVFIGVSARGLLTPEMVSSMAKDAVVFAIANPEPEILPDLALEAGAKVAASGRSDFNNQINNSLVFPGLFKGVLQNGLKKVDDSVKIKAALALAEIVTDEELSEDYIIPDALDKRVPVEIMHKIML